MTTLIGIALVALALIATPLFLVFGAAALVLFESTPGESMISLAIPVFSERFADSPHLATIPLFTLAGYMMAEGGTPKRLIDLSSALLGWLPGGLAIVCLCTSAFFTTFTGGSGITIVAIGGLLLPALVQEKYPKQFSLGLVTAAGSLGIMFPPALPLILYGIIANIVIDKLFLAGIIPGVLTVLALSVYAGVVGTKAKIPRVPFNARRAAQAIWHTKWELGLPIVVVGGLVTGILRIHEASALTGLYVFLIEVFIYRELKLKDFPRIVRQSMTLVGAIMAILAMAIGFTEYLIQAEIPMHLLHVMQSFITSKVMFLLVLNVFLLIAGMVMEIFAAIFVVVPLIVPIAQHFGIDPYHLALVFLVNLEIAYLAPPLGLNLMISSFRFSTPMTTIYRSILPFMGVLALTLLVTTYIPELSTYLPSLSSEAELTGAMGGPPPPAPEPGAEGPEESGEGGTLDDLDFGDLDSLDSLEDLEADTPPAAPAPAPQGAPPSTQPTPTPPTP